MLVPTTIKNPMGSSSFTSSFVRGAKVMMGDGREDTFEIVPLSRTK